MIEKNAWILYEQIMLQFRKFYSNPFFRILLFQVAFLIFFSIAIFSLYFLLVGLLLQSVALFQSRELVKYIE